MHCLILGCGATGSAAGIRLAATGWSVTGIRRTPDSVAPVGISMITGDASIPSLWPLSSHPDVILVTATPGLRRGRDHGVAAMVRLASLHHPDARMVYTGTTSVYADTGGHPVDEHGTTISGDPSIDALLAIEHAVTSHPGPHLILRVTALIGPRRQHIRTRIATCGDHGRLRIQGPITRPFNHLHDDDLTDVLTRACTGSLGTGLLNAAAPLDGTVLDYYQSQAATLGLSITIEVDTTVAPAPSRNIDAQRLRDAMGPRPWRGFRTAR